jgi:integrase
MTHNRLPENCKRSADEYIREILSATSPTLIPGIEKIVDSLRVSELFKLYAQSREQEGINYAESSKTNQLAACRNIVRSIGDIEVHEFRHRDTWNAFKTDTRLSLCSRDSTVRMVSILLRYFHNRGQLSWRPDIGPMVSYRGKPKRVPTLDELDLMYQHMTKQFKQSTKGKWSRKIAENALMARCALVVQYICGFRVGALRRIKLDNIRWDQIQLKVPKTGRWHTIPMHPVMLRHLKLLVSRNRHLKPEFYKTISNPPVPLSDYWANTYLFEGLQSSTLNKWYANACDSAGIGWRITSHRIRAACADQWNAVSPQACDIIHGCASYRMSSRYFTEKTYLMPRMARLPIPQSFLTKAEREGIAVKRERWNEMFDALSEKEIETMFYIMTRFIDRDEPTV